MKRSVVIGMLTAMMATAAPAWALQEGEHFLVPLAEKTEVRYVVYAKPSFDGTGIASRQHLDYRPFDGVLQQGDQRGQNDYYRVLGKVHSY